MKRFLLFAALFAAFFASAQKLDKETFVYAVKGADTLRLDRYTSLSPDSRMSPCLIFAFGGGFFTGGRDESHYVPYLEYYARQGWTVVSIDYRRDLKTAVNGRPSRRRILAPGSCACDRPRRRGPLRRYGLCVRPCCGVAYRSDADRRQRLERRGYHGPDGRIRHLQRSSADPAPPCRIQLCRGDRLCRSHFRAL